MLKLNGPRKDARALIIAVGLVLGFGTSARSEAQSPSPPPERVPLTAAELETLAGPIALYPDDLVSIVLPASTYPLQIVQAARYLEAYEADTSLEPDPAWDDSVVALLNYPEVIELLNDDLDWTWELGEAALYQQTELLNAIQTFRDRAYAAGNLRSDERQEVKREAETIIIKPADPKVIYVPYYEPRHVVLRHTYPVYHYYPRPYPVYYYPYPYGHSFSFNFFWGVTTAFSIGWHTHYLNVYRHHHHRHPYYGHYYHYPWYRRHSVSLSYGGSIWRPSYYSGATQQHTARIVGTNRTLGTVSSVSSSRSRYSAAGVSNRSATTRTLTNTRSIPRSHVNDRSIFNRGGGTLTRTRVTSTATSRQRLDTSTRNRAASEPVPSSRFVTPQRLQSTRTRSSVTTRSPATRSPTVRSPRSGEPWGRSTATPRSTFGGFSSSGSRQAPAYGGSAVTPGRSAAGTGARTRFGGVSTRTR